MLRRLWKARKMFVVYAALLIFLIYALWPIYWMFRTSIAEQSEIFRGAISLFPKTFTLTQYREAINRWSLGLFLRNSIVVATMTTSLTVPASSLAAYSLVRLRYPGRGTLARSVLFVYLVPSGLVFIPLFVLMARLGLLNSLLCLILAYQTFGIPFCTWMLIGYFRGIPEELEEAALIDGCSRVQSLRFVLLPLAAPGLVAAAIFTFTGAWNEFLYALVFVQRSSVRTLPVGLAALVRGDVMIWGPMMAGAVMATIPVMVVYVTMQRFVVQGLGAGAIKG